MRRWLLLCLLAGCAQGKKEEHPFGNYPDAGTDAAVGDDATLPDAPASCLLARSVYLNFTGVTTLTQGLSSDATHDVAGWMQQATGTAPIFRAGSGTRNADIAAITAGITNALAPFHVQVVTTRPAAGPYQMIVFGGTPAQVGSAFSGAVQKLDCGNQVLNDVAWIGDNITPNQAVINFALGAVGFGVGLTATTTTTDCMCGWDNSCTPNFNQVCTFSASIARDGTANQTCPGVTDQNEPASLMNAFCQ